MAIRHGDTRKRTNRHAYLIHRQTVIPVVCSSDRDETMEDVEESAPDIEMDEMESAPCETGITIPQILAPQHQETRGVE